MVTFRLLRARYFHTVMCIPVVFCHTTQFCWMFVFFCFVFFFLSFLKYKLVVLVEVTESMMTRLVKLNSMGSISNVVAIHLINILVSPVLYASVLRSAFQTGDWSTSGRLVPRIIMNVLAFQHTESSKHFYRIVLETR